MSIDEVFEEHRQVVADSAAVLPPVVKEAALLIQACLAQGNKVLVCGNGGSAADAQHFAAELLGRFEVDRRAFAAVALTTDSSSLTAIANDLGFDQIFSRQVEALARPGDVLVAISTSGDSANVVRAAQSALAIGCTVVGMTGQGGGALAEPCDLLIAVPSSHVARIQEVHSLCLHALCGAIEQAFAKGGA
jgi:D-sedoheptulose 7-phosphate isomerase